MRLRLCEKVVLNPSRDAQRLIPYLRKYLSCRLKADSDAIVGGSIDLKES